MFIIQKIFPVYIFCRKDYHCMIVNIFTKNDLEISNIKRPKISFIGFSFMFEYVIVNEGHEKTQSKVTEVKTKSN